MARKKTHSGPNKTGKQTAPATPASAAGGPRLYTLDVFLIGGPVTSKFAKQNPVVARTILIRGDQTLEDLHHAIFDAFNREEEHAYEFQLDGKGPMDPKANRYVLPVAFEHRAGEGKPPAGRVDRATLDALGLKEEDAFGYWFDFGDDWWHQVNVEAVEQMPPSGEYPQVTKKVGASPPQYADLDEDEQDEGGAQDELLRQVPAKLRPRLAEVVALTDRFCDKHLNEEFKGLCRNMAVALCQGGCPLTGGKAAGWAAGIVYSVGWVNFLGDPSQPHHMTAEDMADAAGVSPATLMNRSKDIRKALDPGRRDPRWSTKGMTESNPLVWMVEVNGLPFDIRQVPRHVQEDAVRRGIIPFLPGEDATDKDPR